jgi:PBP1b-binding outer membrane lipoprotein LpoB
MKKVLLLLIVAGLLAACSNNADSKTEEKKETKDSNTIKADSPKTKAVPSQGMTPLDSNGRRPRD